MLPARRMLIADEYRRKRLGGGQFGLVCLVRIERLMSSEAVVELAEHLVEQVP